MYLRPKTIFIAILAIVAVWFLVAERAIFTPFIVAGIFAYLFNPVVDLSTRQLKIPRAASIFLIYGVITCVFVIGGIILSSRIITESIELRRFLDHSLSASAPQVVQLPDWLRPTVVDVINNLKRARAMNILNGQSLFLVYPQAIARIISFLIFLVSTFYFLKDGEVFFQKLISYTPNVYKTDVEILFKKINMVLGGYLRGQIFLVFLMSIATSLALLIVGVRFAVLIGLFSGFAEIVPIVGPIVAGSVAVLVVLLTGTANFGLSAIQAGVIVAAIYFVLRQLEDYFVIPYVMGKITQLPSFVIFFAVIAGGHIAGVLGLILAVPTAAVLRILLQFSFNEVSDPGK